MADAPENSAGTGRRGRFQKGVSGNPGGRPRVEGEVRDLAQKHGPRAIRRLAKLVSSKNERVAVAACQALLDRGYGKPPQAFTGGLVSLLPSDFDGLISFEDGGPGQEHGIEVNPRPSLANDQTETDR